MNRFTLRSALVLAVVLLLAGATTSFAQVIFAASAGNPQVRVGGMTETVGDAALTSTNGNVNGISFPAGSGSATITLTYSSTITNKTLTGASVDCLMLAANTPVACPLFTLNAAAGGTNGIQVKVSNITINDAAVAPGKLSVAWIAAGNTLTIQFAPSTTTLVIYFNGSGGTVGGGLAASINIHGVRINAAGLGIPPTLPTVSAFLNTNPSANIQLAAGSTSLTVGTLANAVGSVTRLSGSTNTSDFFYEVKANLACTGFTAGACTAPAVGNAAAKILPRSSYDNCAVNAIPQGASTGGSVLISGKDATVDRDGDPNFGLDGAKNTIGLKIVEGYPGAFTSKTDEGAKSNAAEVDNGTRIRIDFSGLPAQVVVAAPVHISTTYSPTALTGMSNATSGLVMDLSGNYQNCAIGACAEKPHSAIADVRAASGGAVMFEYEVAANSAFGASPLGMTPVLTASPGVASAIIIPIFLFRTSTPIDLGTINIAVSMGPRLGSTIIRFSDQLTVGTATVAVNSCTTELFYPFVTNTAGFDTGIYVLNGGQARGGNNGQSGPCVARFYDGSTTGTTAVKSSTLPTLGPGQSFSFTASDATLGKPGFGNGYVQVTCPFQAAHGAAYVTFGFGTAAVGSAPPGTMYLALIDDSRGSRSSR